MHNLIQNKHSAAADTIAFVIGGNIYLWATHVRMSCFVGRFCLAVILLLAAHGKLLHGEEREGDAVFHDRLNQAWNRNAAAALQDAIKRGDFPEP